MGEILIVKERAGDFHRVGKELCLYFSDYTAKFISEADAKEKNLRFCPVTGVVLDDKNSSKAKLTGVGSIVVWDVIARYLYRFRKCKDCGRITTMFCYTNYATEEGVCSDCMKANYYTCSHCGMAVKKSCSVKLNNAHYCRNCWSRYGGTCEECGEKYIDFREPIDKNGNRIRLCQTHLFLKYRPCSECGRWFVPSDGKEYNGEFTCNSCIDTVMSNNDMNVLGYHCFKNIKYMYGRRKLEEERGKKLRFYGVELETEDCCFDNCDVYSWLSDGNLIHAEQDGSLDDDGVEWISMPCTLEYHRKSFDWKGFCKELVSEGARSHQTSTCGLHIHVNRDALSPSLITKLDFLMNRMKMLNIIMARRNMFYSSDYEVTKRLNHFCGYWDDMSQSLEERLHRSGEYHNVGRRMDHGERYSAVNVTNPATVEFRVFRGTLNPDTLVATIGYVDAMISFAETAKPFLFKNKTRNVVLCHAFLKFLYDNKDKYSDVLATLVRLLNRSQWRNSMLGMTYEERCNVEKHILSGEYDPNAIPSYDVENDNRYVSDYEDNDEERDDDDDC